MVIIGLTGSIATGKSFVARCFAKLGAKVFDADKTVHGLLTYGAAVSKIKEIFPEVFEDGVINRKKLGAIIFADEKKRKMLEEIIHPLVVEKRKNFIKESKQEKVKIVVLEIPLLFETGAEKECNRIIVTTADAKLQEKRAMEREGMTKEKFEKINKLQMGSEEKVKKADFVIDTGLSEFAVFREVKRIISLVVRD